MSWPRDKAEVLMTWNIMVSAFSVQVWLAAEENKAWKPCRKAGMSDSEIQMMLGVMVVNTFVAHREEITDHLAAGNNPQEMITKLRFWFTPEAHKIDKYVKDWVQAKEQFESESAVEE